MQQQSQSQTSFPLQRNLINTQIQAYAGATGFFYCFIPTVMVSIVFGHLFVLQAYISNPQLPSNLTINPSSLVQSFILIFISAIAFYFAGKVYIRCNLVEVFPVIPPIQLTQELPSKIESEQQGQHSLMGRTKPERVYCKVCKITCDYRTKHCKKCQVCIQRFDHHCFWIGNCVGRHNHRPFYLFLLYQTINNTLNFITICHLTTYLDQLKMELHLLVICLIWMLKIMALGFIGFTGYLLVYHTMLICNGITTWEHMRKPRISYLKYLPPGYNPFSKGVINNWKQFFSQQTRETGAEIVQNWSSMVPTFKQSESLEPVCNLIENQYYSCC